MSVDAVPVQDPFVADSEAKSATAYLGNAFQAFIVLFLCV